MSDGIPQATVIIGATLAFAGLAWHLGMIEPHTHCPQTTEVIRYFPAPEVRVVMPPVPLNWPVEERQRADDTPAVEQASAKEDDAEEQPRRRHYRHRRHRWR